MDLRKLSLNIKKKFKKMIPRHKKLKNDHEISNSESSDEQTK